MFLIEQRSDVVADLELGHVWSDLCHNASTVGSGDDSVADSEGIFVLSDDQVPVVERRSMN